MFTIYTKARKFSLSPLLLPVIVLLTSFFTKAESEFIKAAPAAQHISTLGNINLGEVNAIFQDSRDYMWFGTNEGLIRFDGFNAQLFKHDPNNPDSIGHNRIFDVTEGPRGNMWINTFGGGLYKYDPRNKKFTHIDLRTSPNQEKPTENLYDMRIDKSGVLWMGSLKQPLRYDLVNQKPLPLPEVMQQKLSGVNPEVLIDSKGGIWVSTLEEGVFHFEGNKVNHYTDNEFSPFKLYDNTIRFMYEDSRGNVWLGSQQGLHGYNLQKRTMVSYKPSDQPPLAAIDNDIFTIIEDDDGKLWLGGVLNGIYTFDPKTEKFSAVSGDNDLAGQFRKNRVNYGYKDKTGSLWFATFKGLVYLPKTAQKFQYLTNKKVDMKISQIKQYSPDKLMFASKFALYDLDLPTLAAKQLQGDFPRIYRLDRDSKNNWYVATIDKGVMGYDLAKNQLQEFDATFTKGLTSLSAIFDVRSDAYDRIWVLPLSNGPAFGGGLVQFDQHEKVFEWKVERPYFIDVLPLNEEHVLLSSGEGGIYSYYPKTEKLEAWQDTVPETPIRVQTMFIDSQQRIWLAGENQGLAQLHLEQKRFEYLTTNDGLLSDFIVSITEDPQGNLWLGSSIGLTRYNPETKAILNIEKQDGLQFSAMYKRAAVQLDDGRLLMGTRSGLVLFNPQDFNTPAAKHMPLINDFRLFNKTVAISSKERPTVLNQAIEFADHITLSADDYLFSFDFSTTEYQRPDKVLFAYRMKGLDDKWIYTDAANRRASYTTLPPNDYEFEVKVTNAQGIWSEQTAAIKVTVLPPWYMTKQAIAAYIITVLLSIYLYVRIHTAKLKRQAKELEDKVTERTNQLQTSRDELAKKSQTVSELLAQKQRLFASVSHEFRTPLTLILSPIDQLIKKHQDDELGKELSLVKRNGRRLLRMVDQLLEFAKLEQQNSSQSEAVALADSMDVISASFQSLVATKKISLKVADCPKVILWLLPDSLNKILINILSNAFKYTPTGGAIEVSFEQNKQLITIAVRDNGIGIAEQDKQAIFERFNRATHDHGEAIAGAGIGLSLVKELTEANGGTIVLESELGKGSTFTLTLPLATKEQAQSQKGQAKSAAVPELLQLELESAGQNAQQSSTTQDIEHQDNRKSILVIDDNADMRQLLKEQLGEQYQCWTAADGEQGLKLAREHLPDMVISDIMMPVMDGYELAQHLRGDMLTSHVPIILLTAKGSVESRIKGLKLLVDDYLPKPFNIEELLLRINNILSIRDIIAKRHNQALEQDKDGNQIKQLGLNDVEQQFVEQINKQLSDNYQDIEFGAKRLSEQMALSERQLHRKIRALFDVSIPEMVRNFRLKKAQQLLEQGNRASQVYFSVGFASHSYFSSCFKAKFGQSPRDFQKSHGE